MTAKRPRLARYTCTNEDGEAPKRILATDLFHAAEQYFRDWIEDVPEHEQNCIGEVHVTAADGTKHSVTVQSQRILDVEALRSKKL